MRYGSGNVGKHGKNQGLNLRVVLLIAILAIGVFAAQADAAVWYAKNGGTGDGSSWANACGSIQTAVNSAAADGGGEIWAAAGVYTGGGAPVLTMIKGVDLYGGFTGTETDRNSRDWVAHVTIIDGQKARYCVKGITGATIDGFTLQNGSGAYGGMYNTNASPIVANCIFSKNTATGGGGGMYNDSSSSPTVTNCTFSGNTASGGHGGGIYSTASLSLTNCTFSGNTASTYYGSGGGIYSTASLSLTNCTFSGNTASNNSSGGGIECNASLSLTNCTFTENTAANDGGAIYCHNGSAVLSLTNCTFTANKTNSAHGGAISFSCSNVSSINNCLFSQNHAAGHGGGIISGNSSTITGCTFAGNSTSGSGGGIYCGWSPAIAGCTFTGNTAASSGGGIYATDSPNITRCVFTQNTSPNGGGLYASAQIVANACSFLENMATSTTSGGGGMYLGGGSSALVNCVFALNNSCYNGGGLYNASSTPTLKDCTFSANEALNGGNGGAIFNDTGSSSKVAGSILWEDTGYAYSGNEIYDTSGVSTVTYSCIQYGWTGAGNINSNPLFVNPADGDCRLIGGSPCINAGLIDGAAATDILGVTRGNSPDMGAYEYTGVSAASFGASATSGALPLTVDFVNRSSGGSGVLTGWSWDFGDTGTSTDENPTHTYTTAGSYTVTLTVTGTAGTGVTTKTNYITVTASTKTTPVITAWPTAGTIRYRQTLASSTLSGGVASVEGAFAFSAPTTVPEAGTFVAPVTFTPTDTTNYSTVSSVASVTVTQVTPTVSAWPTAAAVTYGQTLASSALSGGTASVSGKFTFSDPTTLPSAGTHTMPVTFTPTDFVDYAVVSGTVSVTVNKATPTVSTWPSAAGLTYGQSLSASTLSGGLASVDGMFAFAAPATAPNAGDFSASVIFTPADTANFNTVSGTVSVAIGKATPAISAWPTATAITYGQTLASSALSSGTASVAGSFAFTAPSTVPGTGAYAAPVTFTPADTNNYNAVSGPISVTVNKATPTVANWPAATAIVYGQAFAASTLSGGTASVAGTFAFDAPSTAPDAGGYTAPIIFTPVDTANYLTVSGSVSVTVGKATPTVSVWPIASGLTYSQALANSTLDGGDASVEGTFAFAAPSTVPHAGTYTASVIFTPTDSDNYNTVSGTVSVTVDKATPTVNAWPTAASLFYGQTLAISTLTGGGASVAGTFAFSLPSTIPGAGTYSAAVAFTPTDTADYTTVSGSVLVAVSMATPIVSVWPAGGAITVGQTLALSTLSGGIASVPGTFAFDAPLSVPALGAYSAAVTFTPTDTANYSAVSGTVSVAVNKPLPTISAWPTTSAINYGQTLASSVLAGGSASMEGAFAFTAPGTVPNAGTYAASVTFTPSDSVTYGTVSGTVSVVVNKATPTVSAWPTATAIVFGQTLAASIFTGGTASVPGSFVFDASATAPVTGTYTAAVSFNPADTVNYNTVPGTVSVVVGKATPTISAWPTSSAITYGRTLAEAVLTGGTASVAGTFSFTSSSMTPSAGAYAAALTFTPTDTANYETLSGTVSVEVRKATPTVSAWPTATAIEYGQALSKSTLTGGSASVPGTFTFDSGSTTPNLGTYTAAVIFTPTDSANYATVPGTVAVTVNKATPTVSAWPAARGLNYGQVLASSALSGGTASKPGRFSFADHSVVPPAGSYAAAVIFTPTDTVNYATVSGTVTVAVAMVTPTVTAWPSATAIFYGQQLTLSTLSGEAAAAAIERLGASSMIYSTMAVAGTCSFDEPDLFPNAGAYRAAVTFTPTDTADYRAVSGGWVNVTVNKGVPTVSAWPTATALTYGQTLASCALSGGSASVPGTFAFDTPATIPNAGENQVAVTFTPANTANYTTVSGTVQVMVGGQLTVPDVAGMTQAEAATAITGAGLAVGTVTQAYHATIPSGNVISQSPVGGTQVGADTAVNLTVSKGPAPTAEKPAVPANLRASAGVAGVVLTWSANAEPDLAGYNVYRGSEAGGSFTKANSATVTATRYEDPVAVGETHCYKITAVGTGGVESDPTAAACVDGTLVLWLQSVSAQPGEAVRIPFNITNANGIVPNGLDIDFRYDPALIDPASIVIERTAVTAAVNFVVNATEPGRVRISGVGDQELVGEGHLFDLTANMKASAPESQCGADSYALVKFYDAVPTLVPCDYSDTGTVCVSPLCKQGDLNSDGAVDSADVIIALQMAAGLVIPQGCQTDAGDLNGDGVIDSADAIMMQRLAVGLPLNPPQPGAKLDSGDALLLAPTSKAASQRQAAAALAEGFPGEVVDVPVTINDTMGVSGIELTASYPWTTGGIAVTEVQPGNLTGDFLKEINRGNGYVRLALSRAQALAGGTGTVAILRFAIPATAQPGTVLPVRLNAVGLKGQFGDSFSWYGDVQAVDGRVTVKAKSYAVTVGTATGGNITLNPAQPTGGYTAGTSVIVTAAAGTGFAFTNWTGALSGNVNPATLVVNGPKTVGAVFTAETSEGEGEPTVALEAAAQALIDAFAIADADHSGGLSEAEALVVLPGLIHDQFTQLDVNGDGLLTRNELNQTLNTGGCTCMKSGFSINGLKGRLADLFLMGLALTSLLAIRGRRL